MRSSLRRIAALAILCLVASPTAAQTIFPDLTGDELIDALRASYAPTTVYSYGTSRDIMFAEVDGRTGTLTCVYTGYSIALDPNADPTSDAYSKDINTEHTWPQSLGAGTGDARADMHHLFPTRVDVNSSRGNNAFGEITDAQTTTWWFQDQRSSSVPSNDLDAWSERSSTRFEPREDHEGDVARAMFYFYVMYESQADDAFFELQKGDLRAWNALDGPSTKEITRTNLIEEQQGNVNPFVLDPTLVDRAFFPELLPVELVAFTATVDEGAVHLAWRTASETANAGFELQRLTTAGVVPVAFVEGGGTTTIPTSYTHRLNGLDAGYHTFRLKQIDLDGTFSYSASVEVWVAPPRAFYLASAYPNPFATSTTIPLTVGRSQDVRVEVFDVRGRRVALLHDGRLEAGVTHRLTFDGTDLPPGLYLVRASGPSVSVHRSVLRMR